jgi:UbiD family decarboxylase
MNDAVVTGAPPDLHTHMARLEAAGLLVRIDREIDKDSLLHPLARWQFQGGLHEDERRAFLFTNVVDADGRHYDMPVLVGGLSASPAIYAAGLGVPVEQIGKTWVHAVAAPIAPVIVGAAPCQEVVQTGAELTEIGLGQFPVPISTPGFDCAPYLTATLCVTKDPETGVQNMGTYRAALKANDRLGVRMATRLSGAGGYLHFQKYQKMKQRMPIAIVVGCTPAVMVTGGQKLPIDVDEMAVAGGLMGQAVPAVRCKTVDLLVPAESEIVIEGWIDTEKLEPEGPFGESHGYIALEDYNMSMQVTAITQRRDAVFLSIVSQVTPSESSVLKKVAYEPMFLEHLKSVLGVRGIKRVVMHEPFTNLRPVIFLQFAPGTPSSEVWRGMEGAASLQAQCGKLVIAVSEDIDPENADAVFWSLAYRSNFNEDLLVIPHRATSHGPKSSRPPSEGTLLIDATLKHVMPPLALPRRDYMVAARAVWEELGLPRLSPRPPWHGYELGDWDEAWTRFADAAVKGAWRENGEETFGRRAGGMKPETPVRNVKG